MSCAVLRAIEIVVTEPLTTDEDWVTMAPGELMVFVDGALSDCGAATALQAA